ncbi:hypothetical protein JTB14_029738 [Gonioctena quinquepunctata]|nr:hypothetical protein JTB14_029738 [Gonioctena quinquepunctata]
MDRVIKQFSFLIEGYPLWPWLLTSMRNVPPNTPEDRFNRRLKSASSLVERCNGVNHRVLHYLPDKAGLIINACCVLHNMCIENNELDVPPEDGIEDLDCGLLNEDNVGEEEILNRVNPDLTNARRLQRNIIRNHFN